MTTLPFAGPADDLLIPFDPTRGFDMWWRHLDLHTAADPKAAAARKLLEDRFTDLSDPDAETVATVLWAYVRLRLRAGARPGSLRAWLADGDQVLGSVQTALDTVFTVPALRELARSSGQLETSDSPDADDLSRARAEVQTMTAADFGPATIGALAMGAGLVLLALEAEALVHGHQGPDIVYYGHGTR